MADQNEIALELFIKADKAQMTLGDLEKGYEFLSDQIKETDRSTEEGRAKFKKLATQMAGTSKEIKNMELSFEGLDREQVASEIGSVAGAVGDLTTSFILLGGENETMEEVGRNIEKAMMVSMGLKGAIEGLSSARKLYNNLIEDGTIEQVKETIATSIATAKTWLLDAAKKAYAVTTKILTGQIKIATIAQRVFNAVVKANPIALLVTAFVAAGAALIAFASSTKEASREQEILKEIQEDVISGMAKEKSELESLVAIAKDETQTRHARNKAIEELNKLSPEYLGNLTLETINTKEATAAIDSYTESLVAQARAKALQAKLEEAVAKQLDLETQATGNLIEELSAWEIATNVLNDPRETLLAKQKENIAAANEEVDAILNLIKAENKLTDVTVEKTEEVTAAEKAAAEEAERLAKEKAEREKAAQKAWEDNADNRAMARSKEQQAKKDALMEDVEIADKDLTLQTERLDKNTITIEGLQSNEQILHDAKNFWHNKDLERIAEENAARREAAQDAMNLALTTLNAISDVSNTRADEEVKKEEERFNKLRATKQLTEKQIAAEEAITAAAKDAIRKRQFENDKKMQIAMAAINGAQALTSIFAQYPKFDGGFAMVAALASSVITTAATIAKIKATTFSSTPAPALPTLDSGDGGPSGPDAGGGAAITPVSNTSTILGNQKIFVTETDITNTQNNVSVIEESATF
jgi:hypothetical protein